MKKNKGFTLIELLAIIVILAIIAVITVPIILNIIDNSKMGAAQDSAYGYKDAVNKWYVSKLQEDNNLKLNGTYTVNNGNLGNNEILLSGEKPSSGTLTYSNNVLQSGCLTIGDYKVTFSNGEVSSTTKGECEVAQETVLYYTFDANATANAFEFKNSTKVPEIDPSWKYYIKETTTAGVASYGIEVTEGEDTMQLGGIFDTEEECEAAITANSSDLPGENPQCKALQDKTSYELIGIENYGTENAITFSLKPNDHTNSVTTLNTVFPTCGADPSAPIAECLGSSVGAAALAENGAVLVAADSAACYVFGFGLAGCRG